MTKEKQLEEIEKILKHWDNFDTDEAVKGLQAYVATAEREAIMGYLIWCRDREANEKWFANIDEYLTQPTQEEK